LKEIPELRAPENSRTGIEIKPNVKYPDQTEAAIVRFLEGSVGSAPGSWRLAFGCQRSAFAD
jgi:hypothetical protein